MKFILITFLILSNLIIVSASLVDDPYSFNLLEPPTNETSIVGNDTNHSNSTSWWFTGDQGELRNVGDILFSWLTWDFGNNWNYITGDQWFFNETRHTNEFYNKSEVDSLVSSTAFDLFFNNESSSIANHFNMTSKDLDRTESSLDSASLGTGDNQSIFNWTTLDDEPFFNVLRYGLYNVHVHLNVDGSGRKLTTITPKLYNISSDGSSKNLLITFETTSILTPIGVGFNLHGVLIDDVILSSGDRLNLELEANVGVAGANVIIITTMEGTTDSHLTVQTTTSAFDDRFVNIDGDDMTGSLNISGKLNVSGNISTDNHFLGNGSFLKGIVLNTSEEIFTVCDNGTFRKLPNNVFSGDLVFSGSDQKRALRRENNFTSTAIYGGSSEGDGAYFRVTGDQYTTSPGNGSAEFVIREHPNPNPALKSRFSVITYDGASTWTSVLNVIGSTGFVGIGSNNLNPTSNLDVSGNASVSTDLRVAGNYFGNVSEVSGYVEGDWISFPPTGITNRTLDVTYVNNNPYPIEVRVNTLHSFTNTFDVSFANMTSNSIQQVMLGFGTYANFVGEDIDPYSFGSMTVLPNHQYSVNSTIGGSGGITLMSWIEERKL